MRTATVALDPQLTYQTVDGFGANINPVGHWRNGELIPIMDQLTGDLGAVSSTRRLLRGIDDGVRAATVWDAYDNWHAHDDSWTIYGLLRTGNILITTGTENGAQSLRSVSFAGERQRVVVGDGGAATAGGQSQ